MIAVREIDEAGLEAWAALRRRVPGSETAAVEDYVDWKRQAPLQQWLVADDEGTAAGVGMLTPGWHAPPDVTEIDVQVLPDRRERGLGSTLLDELAARAESLGRPVLQAEVREDDGGSLAWAERRGFREVGRNSRLVLELEGYDPPAVDAPPGVEIVTWAERPELAPGMYEVAVEAGADIPGAEDDEPATFEEWLANDMQGTSDRPEATFVAFVEGAVAGFAKFVISNARPGVVIHDLTGVRRAFRGRGIAAALKRTQIAWAKANGYERIETMNEARNEPIRRLNERYGYRVTPGKILLERRPES